MMDSAAYFAISPASSAFLCAGSNSPALNTIGSLGELDFVVAAAAAATTTTSTSTSTSTTTTTTSAVDSHQLQSLSASSSPFNYNSASDSLDDGLDPFDQHQQHNHLHLQHQHHHHHHHHHHNNNNDSNHHHHHHHQHLHGHHHLQEQDQQLYSADYFAEHLCHSAPVGLDRCESPLAGFTGGSSVDVCDYLIDEQPGFQSQDSLSFMSAIGSSLSSGSSDCSLSMGNGAAAYDGTDDIISSNPIDFYSNYYNFNDCLPSDMLMTSQQQQYTSSNNSAAKLIGSGNSDANEYTTTPATKTETATAAESASSAATKTEKRSVLMNLLLDGSDIGAGYTSIDCKTTTPVYFI